MRRNTLGQLTDKGNLAHKSVHEKGRLKKIANNKHVDVSVVTVTR